MNLSQNSPPLPLQRNDINNLRPTKLFVDLSALVKNVKSLKKECNGSSLLAVVKADCYGLGAVQISKTLSKERVVSIFGIATLSEGIELRENGIKEQILVLGALYEGEFEIALKYDITPTIYSFSSLKKMIQLSRKIKKQINVHLKIDSGMGRLGFRKEELTRILEELSCSQLISVEGVFSNLASADDLDSDKTDRQYKQFLEMVDLIEKSGIKLKFLHLANSSGAIFHPSTRFNLIRPGIAMYGFFPDDHLEFKGLKKAVRFETTIIQVKNMPENSEIGYGATYRTKKNEKVAILPIGYGDGLPRILGSEGGFVLINGKKAPFIGRISMDLSAVSLNGIEAKEGEKVTLWGKEGKFELSPYDWAKWARTIPYEILTGISKRVPKIYLE